MGIDYYLVSEARKQVLDIGKCYWLAIGVERNPDVWVDGKPAIAVGLVQQAANGVAGWERHSGSPPEPIVRWLEANAGFVYLCDDHEDWPWADPDTFDPLPEWTVQHWSLTEADSK